MSNTHDENLCWFCKSRSADAGAVCEVDLYRVTSFDQKYVVVAMKNTIGYEKTKVAVPRCLKCKDSEYRNSLVSLTFVWVPLGIAGSIWLIGYSDQVGEPAFLGNIFGVILMFVFAGIPAGLLMRTLSAFSGQGFGYREEKYPEVVALKNQGWKIGKEPGKNG